MVKPREAVPDSRLFSHYHTDFRQRFAQRLMNFPDCTEFINIGIKPQIVIELSLIKGKDAELEKAVAAIENNNFTDLFFGLKLLLIRPSRHPRPYKTAF